MNDFLDEAFHMYESELTRIFDRYEMFKTRSVLICEFTKKIQKVNFPYEQTNSDDQISDENRNDDSETTRKETIYIPTSNQLIGIETNLNEHFKKNVVEEVVSGLERAQFCGSGLTLSRIMRLDVEVCSYEPLDGSSYIMYDTLRCRKKFRKKMLLSMFKICTMKCALNGVF